MKFDIYIFDLDGTLINLGDIGSYVDFILQKTLKKLKAPLIPEKNERRQLWGSGDKFIELLSKWGVPKPQKFWEQYDKVDFKNRKILVPQNKIVLFNDVKTVLEKIYNHKEGKKLAIVTNTSDYIVEYILKKFNISSYFHEFFSMGLNNYQKFAKPSPYGILSILKKFNYDHGTYRAIMIGDSMFDIIAAKKANISACLIKRDISKHLKELNDWEFQPDYIIQGLGEILKL